MGLLDSEPYKFLEASETNSYHERDDDQEDNEEMDDEQMMDQEDDEMEHQHDRNVVDMHQQQHGIGIYEMRPAGNAPS